MLQHGESTAHSAAVLARARVHEACFDHIHRRSHHCGAEAGPEGGGEVTRQVVCGAAEPVSHPLFGVGSGVTNLTDDELSSPVIRSYFRMSSLIMS